MKIISMLAVPVMIAGIVMFGLFKRMRVYDLFTEGARTGAESTLQILPPLVGLMVGIYMLRASGAIDLLTHLLSPLTRTIGMPDEILPLALLRPVSGSGSLALVGDLFKSIGPDSPAGRVASVMMGSTETTFYTITVYFGAIGIKKIKHTLKSALIADFACLMLAVFVTRHLLF